MNTPPRYVISPAAIVKSMWTPKVHQFIVGHPNPSYINSVWLGTGWNLFSLPYRVVTEVLNPLLNFRFGRTIMCAITLPLTVLVIFWHGINGRAQGASVSIDEAIASVILTPQESAAAVRRGHMLVVTDMDAVRSEPIVVI